MHPYDTKGRSVAWALRRRLDGDVYLPGGDQYEAERLGWNRTIDSRPAIIVRATSPEDVRIALVAARELDLPMAVQATGHGTVVACDGGCLLKTTSMASVHIDPEQRLARVGPGATWEQVNAAAAPYGLASLAGRCATVGVTGYTLGGGTGWLSRKFGYAADSVVSAQVVTTEGKLVTAAADENPDLFWALRGGGGNFGLVTAIEFRLYPVDRLFAGMSFHRLDRGRPVLDAYRQWALDEPDEMNSAVLQMRLPPAPSIPAPLRGRAGPGHPSVPPRPGRRGTPAARTAPGCRGTAAHRRVRHEDLSRRELGHERPGCATDGHPPARRPLPRGAGRRHRCHRRGRVGPHLTPRLRRAAPLGRGDGRPATRRRSCGRP